MAKRKPRRYLVKDDTSVRVSPDPDAPDEWIHYLAGQTVSDPPKHADVEGWVKSGHWIPLDDEESE